MWCDVLQFFFLGEKRGPLLIPLSSVYYFQNGGDHVRRPGQQQKKKKKQARGVKGAIYW